MGDGTDSIEDVERFKTVHESDTEWNLRKDFILAHFDKFDEERLICLSCCFINVELYGCSYPPDVMQQLEILKDDIQDTMEAFESKKQSFSAVKNALSGSG